jgi:hypothetical protein
VGGLRKTMAFKKTSGTIVIDATLTERGREKMAKGEFLISKFALGDDEIDYDLYKKEIVNDEDVIQATETLPLLEAYSNRTANIHYGPTTHINQEIGYLPEIVVNNKLELCPDIRDDVYYVSVNDETTEKLNSIFSNSLRFLQTNTSDKSKLIVESGLNTAELGPPSKKTRDLYLLATGLVDQYMYVMCDYRFIESVLASNKDSKFKNFPNGDKSINFETLSPATATSHENGFKYFYTYLTYTTPNLMSDHTSYSEPGLKYSNIIGPRGTAMALNFAVDPNLRTNSGGLRDARWNQYGKSDQVLFSDKTSEGYKFDYIETTIYIVGAISHAEIQVPVRLIRYVGT